MQRILLLLLALTWATPALAQSDDAPDAGGDADDDDALPGDDDDDALPGDDDDGPMPGGDDEGPAPEADDPPAAEDEDEVDLDARYRVEVPEEETDAAKADALAEEEKKRKKRGLTKVIARKFFLKYRRLELTVPVVGYVGTDDFIQRLAFGGSLGYHVNDILSVELFATYLPRIDSIDFKPLTRRLQNRDEVVPDVSRITFLGSLNVAVSPIYGKAELGRSAIINYDIYVTAGAGLVSSQDDVELTQDPAQCVGLSRGETRGVTGCEYVFQEHFATNLGGGFRIVFNEFFGLRLDVRSFIHIEQSFRGNAVGLDTKNNLLVSLGTSFFLPPKARR